jgi:hypothetical protein
MLVRPNLRCYEKVIKVFLLIFYFFMLIPWYLYAAPDFGLDQSWGIAITWGFQKGFVWGKDIIFTYGPLGFLSTRFLNGISNWVLVLFDLFRIVQVLFITAFLFKKSFSWQVVVLTICGVLFLNQIIGPDSGLLLLFLTFFWYLYYSDQKHVWALVVATINTILAFYIKLNAGFLVLFAFPLFIIYFRLSSILSKKNTIIFLISFFVCLATTLWSFHVNIVDYFQAALNIIEGYNEGMATETIENVNSIAAGITVLLFFGAISGYTVVNSFLSQSKSVSEKIKTLIVFGGCFIILFLSFKQGFIRAGNNHLFFKMLLPVCGLVYFFNPVFKIKEAIKYFIILCLVFAFTLSSFFQENYFKFTTLRFARERYTTLHDIYLRNLEDSPDFTKSTGPLSKIPDSLLTEIGNATVDIIPWEISTLYYNKLNYSPRPVIQGYAVYNAFLDKKNNERYLSEKAPKYVFFSNCQTIDYRYNFWEEPYTKIALMQNYELIYPKDSVFDEKTYLNAYPDIGNAIQKKELPSGWYHYLHTGINEGRIGNRYNFITDSVSYSHFNKDAVELVNQKVMNHYKDYGWKERRTYSVIPMVFKKRVYPRKIKFYDKSRLESKSGEWVKVPKSDSLLYVNIDIPYHNTEKLLSLIEKPPLFRVVLKLASGQEIAYRIILPMLRDGVGVLINKSVMSEQEAYVFFKKSGRFNPDIVEFKVIPSNPDQRGRDITVVFKSLAISQ